MAPGAIVTTLMPYLPKSLAIGKVIEFIADLDAAYAIFPLVPYYPTILDILIITPPLFYYTK